MMRTGARDMNAGRSGLSCISRPRPPTAGSSRLCAEGGEEWSVDALANDVGELQGVRPRLVGLTALIRRMASRSEVAASAC